MELSIIHVTFVVATLFSVRRDAGKNAVLFPDYPLELAALGLSGSFVYLAHGLTRLDRGARS